MPFIEIITDTKSQIELNKMMSGEIVNNCDIMYIKEKNIENIKNIKLETLIINKEVKNNEIMNKIIFNAKNLIYNKDFNEKLFIGKTQTDGGRVGEPSAYCLTEQLNSLGIQSDRMKTGTPPRIDIRSVNLKNLLVQPGDDAPQRFSFLNVLSPIQKYFCTRHMILQTG